MLRSTMSEKKHRLAFAISPQQSARTEAVIAKLRADGDRRAHAGELTELVIDLTETGLRSYFLQPLEIAGVGLVSRNVAKLGIATVGKSIPVMVRKILGAMSGEQLLAIAEVMDEMLIRGFSPVASERKR